MPGITDPSEAYFKDGIWGFDGTVWRKLPLVWGYSDRYVEQVVEPDATVDDVLDTTPVTAGEVWVVTNISAFNNNHAFSLLQVQAMSNGVVGPQLIYQIDPVAKVPYMWNGTVILKYDDYLRAEFTGNTADDYIFLRVWGYKMAIAE